MSRPTQAITLPRNRRIWCEGDSITHNATTGVQCYEFWPHQLQNRLNDTYGCAVKSRNFGCSGSTSSSLVQRIPSHHRFSRRGIYNDSIRYEAPDAVFIMIGVNDYGNGSVGKGITISSITKSGTTATVTTSAAHGLYTGNLITLAGATGADGTLYNITVAIAVVGTQSSSTSFTYVMQGTPTGSAAGTVTYTIPTQRNIEGAILALRNHVSFVAGNASDLPAAGSYSYPSPTGNAGSAITGPSHTIKVGDFALVQTDWSANGGLAEGANVSTGSGLPARVAGAGTGVAKIFVCRNGLAGESGWSRVADNANEYRSTNLNGGIVPAQIVILSTQYLNYPAANGGDGTTPDATNLALRALQAAAAAAQGANYYDLWTDAFNLIGVSETAGDGATTFPWSYKLNNQHGNAHHHNIMGELIAKKVGTGASNYATILAALKS